VGAVLRSLFGRHRDRTLLAVAVLLSCLCLGLDQGTQADLARLLGLSLYAPVQAVARGTEDALLLRRENEQLRRLVASLNLERQRLLQLRDEAAELRRVARFSRDRFPYLKPCEIVGRTTDSFQTALQLGCGSKDSLYAGMPVAAYAGLVGRVRQVTGTRSLLETLASPDMAISVTDQRSGVVGILRWARGNQFTLDRVDAVEDVLVGDPLLTSGLGDYPRGIPVGVVTRVGISLDGLFKQIDVRTHVDFGSLRDVFVVTRDVDWEERALYRREDQPLLQGSAGSATEAQQASGARPGSVP